MDKAMIVATIALIGFITTIVIALILLTATALTTHHNAVQNIDKNKTIKMLPISQENNNGLSNMKE